MPIVQIPNSPQTYYLIAFDADGNERRDDPDGTLGERVQEHLRREPITDVFVISHGWQGDLTSARSDYDKWIATTAGCVGDLEELRRKRAGFKPLVIALHWPSLPFGNEEFPTAPPFALDTGRTETLVNLYAERIASTRLTREALRTILSVAGRDPNPDTLPEEVRAAYAELDRESNLGSKGLGAAPGADREPFDPEQRYEVAQEEAVSFSLGESIGNFVLAPLRELSFWKMKDRARILGERGAHGLLRNLQHARDNLAVHLMGHSFGCIVVSASVAGPPEGPGLPRPVQSLVLVQGALSLWSYCDDIPYKRGTQGYFRRVIAERRVGGPIVTTQSRFDKAVGRWYPLGAGVARQVAFAPNEWPRYGAAGTFGLRGLDTLDEEMRATDQPYDFQSGWVYNLESSKYICQGETLSGAHSDIVHPEVAHLVWSTALASGSVSAPSTARTPTASFAAGGTAQSPAPSEVEQAAQLTVERLLRSAGAVAAELRARVRIEIEIDPQ